MLAAPPQKPRVISRTGQRSRNHYTIHSSPNNLFSLRTQDDRTAVVAFHRRDDAVLMAKMMEVYFRHQKELPPIQKEGEDQSLYLPNSRDQFDLDFLYLDNNNFDDLKVMCTRNILHMITVEQLKENRHGYSIQGSVHLFDAPVEFYQMRFNELLELWPRRRRSWLLWRMKHRAQSGYGSSRACRCGLV